MILQYLLPLITGFVVGAVFTIFKLPIPAPQVIEGILGIFGIWFGYTIVPILIKLIH